MKSLPERLNDRLERRTVWSWQGEEPPDRLLSPEHAPKRDPEVDELVALALRLQSARPLQADPDFARQLEQRILVRNAALRLERPGSSWWFPRLLRVHPVFGLALSLCLLLLLGTGVLAVAAQVTNPNNPLYAVTRWERQVQISLANSPEKQTELELQFARDRLNSLASLANSAHAEAYRKALTELDQQIRAASRAINTLAAGADHDRMVIELAAFKADTRHTLREFLPHLALPERLVTTDELGRLGDTVPRLTSAVIVLPVHPNEQTTVSISGDDIQPGAQLLVDNRLVQVRGSFQNGLYVFVAHWVGNQHPHSIGILNPDETAAQTTVITPGSSNEHGNGSSNHVGNEKGNGNGKGKP